MPWHSIHVSNFSPVHRLVMRTFSFRSTAIRRALCAILLGAVVVLLAACDSTGPQSSPEPQFNMNIGGPVNTSLSGAAALGSNLSFNEQNVFIHPGPFGNTVTIIQLSGEADQGATHDLSFVRLADRPLEPGTYEVGTTARCDSPCGPEFPPDELFTASYGRETADSLHFYPLESGTVNVETATEEVVEGTFTLDAALEASVSRAAMEAFRDSLLEVRGRPPSDSTDLPRPPEPTIQFLESPMTIEGSFTATAEEQLSGQVPHLGGFGVRVARDTIVTNP
jgi:hypothetical protein